MLVGVGLYLLFVEIYSSTLADVDLWGYIAFGRVFWETGQFPYHDLFAYTPTKDPWVYHEWLTGVLYYDIYRLTGNAGLQLLRYVLILATIYLIYLTAVRRGSTPLAACVALIPAMLLISFGYVPVRAQMFTYFFFALTLYILENARLGQRWPILAWLLPIQVLWCNFHGGFIAGLGLIGLYGIGEALSGRKSLPILAAGILAAAVTFINPYGARYWLYIAEAAFMPRPEINEWVSVVGAIKKGIYTFPAYLFSVMASLALVGYLLRRRRDHVEILVIGAMIFIGISHVRHSVFLGLVFGAYLPLLLSEHWHILETKASLRAKSWIPGGILVCLVLLSHFVVNPSRLLPLVPSFTITTPQSRYPVDALNWMMQNGLKGNILPFFDWGEFIIWHSYPDCRVAMDGRYETVYEDHVQREYFDFLFARPTWRVFLEKYPHEMILIHSRMRIAELMKREKGWRLAYGDQLSLLFIRTQGR
ncbi:MAG: hypothetical protein ACYDAA_00575 [Syntrophales bacterium]